MSLEGGWMLSNYGDVFLKGVLSMDVAFVVVDLISQYQEGAGGGAHSILKRKSSADSLGCLNF